MENAPVVMYVVEDESGNNHVAIWYHGFLDGSWGIHWYDAKDYPIEDVMYWMELPYRNESDDKDTTH